MSDSAVCTKKQTIKTVINIKLRSAWGAIVSATFLYGAPRHTHTYAIHAATPTDTYTHIHTLRPTDTHTHTHLRHTRTYTNRHIQTHTHLHQHPLLIDSTVMEHRHKI